MLIIKTKKGPKGGYIGQLQNGNRWIINAELERVNKRDALDDAAQLRLECVYQNLKKIDVGLICDARSLKKKLDFIAI